MIVNHPLSEVLYFLIGGLLECQFGQIDLVEATLVGGFYELCVLMCGA